MTGGLLLVTVILIVIIWLIHEAWEDDLKEDNHGNH